MSAGFGKKRFRGLLLIILMFSGISISTAAGYDYITVETLTSRYFAEQRWDSVITIGKKAIREDIDYYYLRLRLGISYYMTEKYFDAIEHLNSAVAFNSSDPVPYTYLHEAYLKTGRTAEARNISGHLRNVSPDSSFRISDHLENTYAEGGYILSSDEGKTGSDDLFGNDSIYGVEDLYGDSYYGYFRVKGNIGHSISINLGYTYLKFNKIRNIQYGYFTKVLDSIGQFWWGEQYYYSFPRNTASNHFTYEIDQHEFHLGAELVLPDQYIIMPAFHLIYGKYNNPVTTLRTTVVHDTAWVDTSVHTFPFMQTEYSFSSRDTSFTDYVISLRLQRSVTGVRIAMTGSYSNVNGLEQVQTGISLGWFPLKNTRLYESTDLIAFFQEGDTRLIVQQAVGGNPWKNLWLDGYFTWGDVTNANLSNASLVYNNTGRIKYIAGCSASWFFTGSLAAVIGYQYALKESVQSYYTTDGGESRRVNLNYKYNIYTTNSITLGIKWNI